MKSRPGEKNLQFEKISIKQARGQWGSMTLKSWPRPDHIGSALQKFSLIFGWQTLKVITIT